MTKLFQPYGSAEHVSNVAKVGKGKSPPSLAARMPSAELAAKVGQNALNFSSARVVRRNAKTD